MLFEIQNSILNDVLCYISTARDSISKEDLIAVAAAFYKLDEIKKSKELLCKISGEQFINRWSSKEFPDPAVADLTDMFDIFVKLEGKNFLFPSFLAKSYTSLPPQSGFLGIARLLNSLRDEVTALKTELSQVREAREADFQAMDDIQCVKQDIKDIKNVLHSHNVMNNVHLQNSSTANVLSPSTYADVAKARIEAPLMSPRQHKLNTNNGIRQLNAEARQFKSEQQQRNDSTLPPKRESSFRRRPKQNIKGTRESSKNENGLHGAQREFNLYIGGCKLSTTTDNIADYCKKETQFSKLKCTELTTKNVSSTDVPVLCKRIVEINIDENNSAPSDKADSTHTLTEELCNDLVKTTIGDSTTVSVTDSMQHFFWWNSIDVVAERSLPHYGSFHNKEDLLQMTL